jgi:hypothetical protein
MEENTTTEEVVQETGAETALPVENKTESAEQSTTEEPSESATGESEDSLPSIDEKLTNFAKAQGIEDVSELSERELRLLKVARDNQAEFQRNRQKASELEKVIDQGITEEAETVGLSDDDRLDIVRIKTKLSVREFFDNNPDAKPFEQAMIQELQNKPHLAGDLESLYANAVVKSGNLKSEGKKEALQSLAHKQTAAVPKGNAVTSAMTSETAITPQNVDQMVARMSVDEYRKRLPEINKALTA